jgi:hypothetical protein
MYQEKNTNKIEVVFAVEEADNFFVNFKNGPGYDCQSNVNGYPINNGMYREYIDGKEPEICQECRQ